MKSILKKIIIKLIQYLPRQVIGVHRHYKSLAKEMRFKDQKNNLISKEVMQLKSKLSELNKKLSIAQEKKIAAENISHNKNFNEKKFLEQLKVSKKDAQLYLLDSQVEFQGVYVQCKFKLNLGFQELVEIKNEQYKFANDNNRFGHLSTIVIYNCTHLGLSESDKLTIDRFIATTEDEHAKAVYLQALASGGDTDRLKKLTGNYQLPSSTNVQYPGLVRWLFNAGKITRLSGVHEMILAIDLYMKENSFLLNEVVDGSVAIISDSTHEFSSSNLDSSEEVLRFDNFFEEEGGRNGMPHNVTIWANTLSDISFNNWEDISSSVHFFPLKEFFELSVPSFVIREFYFYLMKKKPKVIKLEVPIQDLYAEFDSLDPAKELVAKNQLKFRDKENGGISP